MTFTKIKKSAYANNSTDRFGSVFRQIWKLCASCAPSSSLEMAEAQPKVSKRKDEIGSVRTAYVGPRDNLREKGRSVV